MNNSEPAAQGESNTGKERRNPAQRGAPEAALGLKAPFFCLTIFYFLSEGESLTDRCNTHRQTTACLLGSSMFLITAVPKKSNLKAFENFFPPFTLFFFFFFKRVMTQQQTQNFISPQHPAAVCPRQKGKKQKSSCKWHKKNHQDATLMS